MRACGREWSDAEDLVKSNFEVRKFRRAFLVGFEISLGRCRWAVIVVVVAL